MYNLQLRLIIIGILLYVLPQSTLGQSFQKDLRNTFIADLPSPSVVVVEKGSIPNNDHEPKAVEPGLNHSRSVSPNSTPKVTGFFPANGAVLSPGNNSISLQFSEILDTATVAEGIWVTGNKQGRIPGTWDLSVPDSVVFIPTEGILAHQSVTVTIHHSLRSAIGVQVAGYTLHYHTVPSPLSAPWSPVYEPLPLRSFSSNYATEFLPADLDKDGDLDLVGYTSEPSNQLVAFYNRGGGNFGDMTRLDTENLSNFAITDFNYDGYPDLVVASGERLVKHQNNGNNRFSKIEYIDFGQRIHDVNTEGDLNNDGYNDYVITTNSRSRGTFIYDGKQKTTRNLVTTGSTFDPDEMAFPRQFNTNGRLDIITPAIAMYSANRLTNGLPVYQKKSIESNFNSWAIHPADYDQDGDMDLFYFKHKQWTTTEVLHVLENNGKGIFTPKALGEGGNYGLIRMTVGDIDSDGDLDVIGTGYNSNLMLEVFVFRNMGEGQPFQYQVIEGIDGLQGSALSLEVGDVDEDGDTDIIFGYVYFQNYFNRQAKFRVYTSSQAGANQAPVANFTLDTLVRLEDTPFDTVSIVDLFDDPDGDVLTLQVSSANPLVSAQLDTLNEVLVIGSSADFFGSATLTVSATDGTDATSAEMIVEVAPVNDPPTFTLSDSTIIFERGQNGTQEVTVLLTQPDNESDQKVLFSLRDDDGIANLVLDQLTGTLQVTRIQGKVGIDTVLLVANDQQYENNLYSQALIITVTANQPPILSNLLDPFTLQEDDDPVRVSIAGLFMDPEGDTLTYSVDSSEPAVTAFWSNDSVVVSLAADYFGETNLLLSATDGINTVSLDWPVTVTPVNDLPSFILSDTQLFLGAEQDSAKEVTALLTQPSNEADQEVIFSLTGNQGIVRILLDSLTGTLQIDRIQGVWGTDTVLLTANDQQAENNLYSQSLIISVSDNAPPIISGQLDSLILQEDDAPIQVSTKGLFTDPDGDSLSYFVSSSNSEVTAVWSTDSIEVAAMANYFGKPILTLIATDGKDTTSYDWRITVEAVNDAPTFFLSEPYISFDQDQNTPKEVTVLLTQPSNEIDQTVIFSLSGDDGIANITLDSLAGTLQVAKILGMVGTDTVILTANDQQAEDNLHSESLIISVTGNRAPIVSGRLDSLFLMEDDAPIQVSTMGLFTDPD
ncbi:MAG TPA: hypothetical protein DCE41_36650, partial [Cytophagales bacterium]|nr:hypothetical protein [Cytophagales bacterium]